ncbi:MAG: transcription antitermination factor NusB [Nitrospirales bacterium]|nr:transcription antitermination factor NusB [Nitrospirales bacterium]
MAVTIPHKPASTKTPKIVSSRRQARQLALQQLFRWEFDQSQNHESEVIRAGPSTSPEIREFANQIVQGVLSHHRELDQLINQFAVEWTVDRMPVVDRNILRWAIFELLWIPHIPARVTLNEAMELAKRFADDDARRFINGMLDHLLREEPRLELKRAELTP